MTRNLQGKPNKYYANLNENQIVTLRETVIAVLGSTIVYVSMYCM